MRIARPRRSVFVGGVAGIAVAGGLLAFAHRPSESWSDEGAGNALERAMTEGVPPGVWELTSGSGEKRERTVTQDPAGPDLVLWWGHEDKFVRVRACPKGNVTRAWFPGDVEQFRRNYRLASRPTPGTLKGRSVVFVRYSLDGCEGCAVRLVAFDPKGMTIVRVEDYAYDGRLVHSAELTYPGVDPSKVRDTPAADLDAARKAAGETVAKVMGSKATLSWEAFLRVVPFPVHEPARLPRGFERVDWSWQKETPAGLYEMDVVGLTYGDGVARMRLVVARSADLQALDDVARRAPRGFDAQTCPAVDEPPELVEGSNVTILRRRNACRTTLRRDFPETGTSVALIASNERPPVVYVETMKSLVPAETK